MTNRDRTGIDMQRKSFWDRGCQYYITGRFAVSANLNPVAANVLHHAIECFLKGALSKTHTLKELFQYQHNLPPLWESFKGEIGDPGLSKFDRIVKALHAYEDLRYPDKALKEGMGSMISSHRFQLPPEMAAEMNRRRSGLPSVPEYELCLQDVDELAEAIFTAARVNPRAFFMQANLKANQDLIGPPSASTATTEPKAPASPGWGFSRQGRPKNKSDAGLSVKGGDLPKVSVTVPTSITLRLVTRTTKRKFLIQKGCRSVAFVPWRECFGIPRGDRLVRPGEELTLGAMRRSGVRGVTICCTSCGHFAKLIPDEWPDEAQLADLQQRFVCLDCGHKGADIEPDFDWDKKAT